MSYTIVETCIGCTACIKACPVDAITGERNKLHDIHANICVDCGLCGYVCPVEAIYDYENNVATRFKKRADSDRIAVVTPDRCTACDFCIDICPFDAISYVKVDDGFFNIASVDPAACKGCDKLCVSVCIKEAIQLYPRPEGVEKRVKPVAEVAAVT